MGDTNTLVSKVLVLDGDAGCYDRIKAFCDANSLVGLKVQADNIMAVLKSNVDLGGILLSENFAENASGGIALAREIHEARPELPIFLRREKAGILYDLPEVDRKSFVTAYTIDEIASLRAVIDECIFSLVYPNALVRGISEMSKAALESQFKGMTIEIETPYIVRDRLIFGEIFTLIPIESSWCRGYMTIQAEEASLLQLVQTSRTYMEPTEGDDFRNLNGILGEITNLIWGAFKNRYVAGNMSSNVHLAQVPIVINHLHRYISFGSTNPQLCFKCTLSDNNDSTALPVVLYQRFVFNLNWSPEDFIENQKSVDDLVDSGELELF
jgi:hypothetical protein